MSDQISISILILGFTRAGGCNRTGLTCWVVRQAVELEFWYYGSTCH